MHQTKTFLFILEIPSESPLTNANKGGDSKATRIIASIGAAGVFITLATIISVIAFKVYVKRSRDQIRAQNMGNILEMATQVKRKNIY